MTITIDPRAGSAQLAPLLRQRGVPVDVGMLTFGDASIMGSGPGGSPVSVGVEVKALGDVLACIQDARFAGHQLPGLCQSYDQIWLLVVGVFRARARDGVLEYQQQRGKGEGYWKDASHGRRRSLLWHDLAMWLLSMQIKSGLRLAIVDDYDQAANWLSVLHSWWSRGWDDHSSHLAMHDAMRDQLFDRALLTRPSITRMIAAQLPNVGRAKSADVAAKFKSVKAMVEASEAEWQSIPGIGKEIAHKAYVALRGGSNGNGNGQ
jgi:ERCC4-type nuclease